MKIALIGYGKMGKAVEACALDRGHQVVLKIDAGNKNDFTDANMKQCDVAIEFTSPDSALDNIEKCFNAGLPLVCGTTGWYDHLEEVKNSCRIKNAAFIYASNFSIGVNIFFAVNQYVAKLMNAYPDYNVSIEETHHLQKLDKPSGTAITLANDILKQIQSKKNWKLANGEINPGELSIVSKREPEVVGTHVVAYTSAIDEITIKHKANNRHGFAQGAVHAAEWLIGKRGFYEMRDMLGLS